MVGQIADRLCLVLAMMSGFEITNMILTSCQTQSVSSFFWGGGGWANTSRSDQELSCRAGS